jgi:ABC-type lipoprotein release transport system permease subunit
MYNELSFRFRPDADRSRTSQALTRALQGLKIERAMPLESNFGFRYVENVLGGSRIFMPMTALLLAAMAGIVAVVIVTRLISDRRREIGALMAQGFSTQGFVGALLILGVVPAFAGALIGIPGAMLFAQGLAETNASIAGLPPPIMIYPLGRLLSAFVAALVVGVMAVLVASVLALRGGPGRMLRSDGGMAHAPKRLSSWLASLSSAIAFRYATRNVSRRLGLSASAVLLVGLAVAMPAGMLTAMSSWDIWARDTAASLAWDAAVSFKVPLTESAARALLDIEGIRAVEPWLQGYATLSRAGSPAQEMRVVGIPVPARLHTLQPARGRSFREPNAAELIFNTSFLRGVAPPSLGDVVSLSFEGRVQRLKVVGLVSDASIATLFVPNGTAQRLFDQTGHYSGAYVAFDAPVLADARRPGAAVVAPAKKLEAAILERETVGAVQLKIEVEQAMIVYLHGFTAVVAPFVFLAGLLGFLFLLSVLSLLIAERGVEYATLRSMGYGSRELSGIILTELAWLVIVGLGASVFAWFQLSTALRDLMAHAWFWIPVSLRATDYAFVALPVVAFLLGAAIPATRQLLRADLSSALRERTLG